MQLDALDVGLIELLTDSPMLPAMECARRLGVARGTVTSRLTRLQENGVIQAIIPRIEPAGFGYQLVAFCSVELDQKYGHVRITDALTESIPEIMDMYTVTGDFDLHLRVVARNASELQDVFDRISQVPGVARTSSSLALREHFQGRTMPLVKAQATRSE
ncbi:Lrp/AsnC family transcriptional regulator [Glutamicibacter uratoxydans]|uniref:Lrp/AsnC family transcriptional regulator n=1 Tax=Glutamicibacter uratoxydans TaxID=43667 RepID=UPI003D6E5564